METKDKEQLKHEVIQKICPYCGKSIRSLYLRQAQINLEMHEMNCSSNPNVKHKKGDLK